MSRKSKKLINLEKMEEMARHASARLSYAASSLDHCNAMIEALLELNSSSQNRLIIGRLARAAENLSAHSQHFVDLDSKKLWETHVELKHRREKLAAKDAQKKPGN